MGDPVVTRRVGVMGGTFDPIHHGHLVAASEAAHLLDLDEVVFVPTGQPYRKDVSRVTPAEHRYLMTVIATASNPRFWVSRVDIDRSGPTYTIDTLNDLNAQFPDDELFFITGADALQKIVTWRDWEKMFDAAVPAIEKALAEAASQGIGDPHELEQRIARAISQWAFRKHRRNPLVVPVVIEA